MSLTAKVLSRVMLEMADMGGDGEVVHNRVRHDALHEPFRSTGGGVLRLLPGAWRDKHDCSLHAVASASTDRTARVRHDVASVGALEVAFWLPGR